MLKLITCILVIVALWGLATSEGDDGYCNFGELKIKKGETVPAPIGLCQKITCQEPATNSISALTCPYWRLPHDSKCRKSDKDLTKQYPECCPKKICDDK